VMVGGGLVGVAMVVVVRLVLVDGGGGDGEVVSSLRFMGRIRVGMRGVLSQARRASMER